jgi:hypothetical protein
VEVVDVVALGRRRPSCDPIARLFRFSGDDAWLFVVAALTVTAA